MSRKKQKLLRRFMAEIIFWLHTAILVLITIAGLFIAWYWILLVVVALRLQIYLLHGCVLTMLENNERGVSKSTSCYYLAFRRFFGIRLSKRGVMILSVSQNLLALLVALLATITHTRVHL